MLQILIISKVAIELIIIYATVAYLTMMICRTQNITEHENLKSLARLQKWLNLADVSWQSNISPSYDGIIWLAVMFFNDDNLFRR